MTATILAALVSSYYLETIKPGTFQKALDKTLIANGLPRVIVPIHDILEDYEAVITEIVTDIRQKQTREGQDNVKDKDEEEMEEGEIELDEYNSSQKRTRTQDTPQQRAKRRNKKKTEEYPEEYKKQSVWNQYGLPTHNSHHYHKEASGKDSSSSSLNNNLLNNSRLSSSSSSNRKCRNNSNNNGCRNLPQYPRCLSKSKNLWAGKDI